MGMSEYSTGRLSLGDLKSISDPKKRGENQCSSSLTKDKMLTRGREL